MRRPDVIGLTFAAMLGLGVEAHAQVFEPSMSGWFAGLQATISAIRVEARQDSLGAEQGSLANTNAAMGLANVIVEQEAVVAAREAVARFESMHNDLTTGLCSTADEQRSVARAEKDATVVDAELGGFERRWLERGGDRTDTLVGTHRMRRTVFCSEGERDLGLCEGPLAFGVPVAGDSDASPFLVRRSYGSAEMDVGTVFVDTVAPFPTISKSGDAAAGSVDEMIEHAARRRELALVALARTGLTDVLMRGLEGGTE